VKYWCQPENNSDFSSVCFGFSYLSENIDHVGVECLIYAVEGLGFEVDLAIK
jgi:hypothetical protein